MTSVILAHKCSGEETAGVLVDSLGTKQPSMIISKVAAGNRPLPVVPLHPIVLRERFKKAIQM